jgi:TPR repeat protein
MVELGISLSGLRPDKRVNLLRLAVRDEVPKPNPVVKDFPGWWEGAPRVYVLTEAQHWWRSAAGLGYPRAMTLLGCALAGAGDLSGRDWLERASRLGEVAGLLHLGLTWHDTDPHRALRFYLQAAEQGYPEAMQACGEALIEADRPKAMEWYNKGAAMDEVMAIYDLGRIAKDGPDPMAAEPFFRSSADKGYPLAMYALAGMLRERGPSQTHRLLVEADARGHVLSTLKLAAEARRKGTRRGRFTESKYLFRAADLGSGVAAYDLTPGMWPPSLRKKYLDRAKKLGFDPTEHPTATGK